MDKNFYSLYNLVKQTYCGDCEDKEYCSQSCKTNMVLDAIKRTETAVIDESEGCQICTEKNGKVKEVFYDSGRGGFSIATFCPACGKRLF